MCLSSSNLPKGSLILITGITGFIASHTALEFLRLGYKVRGTVRDAVKAKWLTEDTFRQYAKSQDLEVVVVADMSLENAFDEAVKGVTAVVHLATINTWDANPNNVIPQTATGALNALRAASNEPSVRRFVYTSSSVAAILPTPGVEFDVDSTSWNDTALKLAWAPPPYEQSRGPITYMASKVEAEKAVWKFVEEKKPDLIVNTVLPFTAFGRILSKHQPGSTAAWIQQLYNGDISQVQNFQASKFPFLIYSHFSKHTMYEDHYSIEHCYLVYYIHVRDVAIMHVAAVLDPEVSNERIYAWAKPFNWNDVLAILRKLFPNKTFVDDLPDMGQLVGKVDDELGLKLIKRWGKQDRWTPLEQSVKENLEGLE